MWSRHFEIRDLSAGAFFLSLEGSWGKERHRPVESHGLVGFLQRLARRNEETLMDFILRGAIHIVKNSGIFYRFSLLKKKKKNEGTRTLLSSFERRTALFSTA